MLSEVIMNKKSPGLTRRQAAAGIVLAIVGSVSARFGRAQQPVMQETPSTGANAARTSLHQEIDLNAMPQHIYDLLLDAKSFAAITGLAAEIDPKAGGAFTTFGGLIEGRNIELIPGQRIVQAWRPANWDPGVYSVVHFELKTRGAGTTVVLDHTGFPEGDFDHLDAGWHARYWEPMKKFLEAQG
jgi:activator of HSP90 ATPase